MSITEINTSNRSTTTSTPNNSSVTMTASRSTTVTPNRQAAINGLAVVGFVALIIVGISLAVYSTRFVPTVVNRVGSAAVYLGSLFNPTDGPTLSVISNPNASTTISFGTASSTISTSATTTAVVTVTSPAKPAPLTAGQAVQNTYQVGGTASDPYGLPDFSVTADKIGYLATRGSLDSFVESPTVPDGKEPAVKFTIKNIGTNWSGTWSFSASIPNRTSTVRKFDSQPSLAPGVSAPFVLGFDQARTGSDQILTITVNPDKSVPESNTNNNSATISFDVL